jgi:hypothetical protein
MTDDDDDDDDDDVAAGVIARLSAEAEFVDVGGFTLDPAAARLKLSRHQLASHGAWALLLVEAGELAGVDRIEVSEGVTAVRVRLLGEGAVRLAPPAQLDMLFSWGIGTHGAQSRSASDADLIEARRLLALAINAVLDRSVELTVRTAAAGVRLRFSESASRRGRVRSGSPALIVTVRSPVRSSLSDPAEALVEVVQRAGYGNVPVFVAGRRLEPREVPRRDVCRSSPLSLDGREHGYIGFQIVDEEPPQIVFAPNGVYCETYKLGSTPSTFFAVVTRGVDRDLSLANVIENEAYVRMVSAVRTVRKQYAAFEAKPAVLTNESVIDSAPSDLTHSLLEGLSVVLAIATVVGIVLMLSGVVSGIGAVATIVTATLAGLSRLASVYAHRLQVLFTEPRPLMTSREKRAIYGDPNDRHHRHR